MSFTLRLAEQADIPALASILQHTTLENEWGQIRFAAIEPKTWLETLDIGLQYDMPNQPGSNCVIVLAVIDKTAEIAAFAQLMIPEETIMQPREVATDTKPKTAPSRPAGFNIDPIREYHRRMLSLREQISLPATFHHLADLAVKPEHRRRGIATALMNSVMDYVLSNKGFMYFEATLEGLDLYRKLGFQELGRFGLDLQEYGGSAYYEEVAMRWPKA